MDHAGNVAGPLIGAFLLYLGMSTRHVFFSAVIPAVLVLFILALGIQEKSKSVKSLRRQTAAKMGGAGWKNLPPAFKHFLLAVWVFALGASTDAFILLRFSNLGISIAKVGILWSLHNALKMVSTYYGGIWSDKIGPRPMVLSGWLVYAGVYLAFALTSSAWVLILVFMVYALYYGLSDPSEKAWVTELVPAKIRGTAFGYYNGVTGLAYLPASLIFGWISTAWGAPKAFTVGAFLAVGGSFLLIWVRPSQK
jgi:MFS family permease